MDRDIAEELYAACEEALAALTQAEGAIGRIADDDERRHLMRALSSVIVEILGSIRAPAVLQHPDLERIEPLGQPDTGLPEEDQALISSLRAADLEAIDAALMAECASSWRKVARVVGSAMSVARDVVPGIPDRYYAQRVVLLVKSGRLESQGQAASKLSECGSGSLCRINVQRQP